MAQMYDKGDLVRCPGRFVDPLTTTAPVDSAVWYGLPATGFTLIDPSSVSFKFTTPAGTTTTYVYGTDAQLVKDSTGKYYVDITASEVGIYRYRFESTGTYRAAAESSFTVRPSSF